MITFLQKKDYGIGNTVNCTPALQAIHHVTGEKVIAKFESFHARKLFEKAPFLEIVDKLPKVDLHSGLINSFEPDYLYVKKCAEDRLNTELPLFHTYVDPVKTGIELNLVVFARGCANEAKRHKKDPADYFWAKIVEKTLQMGKKVVFVGSSADKTHNRAILKQFPEIIQKYNSVSQAMKLISSAEYVVMNDTGFYHVAGAYKKKGFIMWKDTSWIKNQSPNKNFIYSFDKYYNEYCDYARFLRMD